MTVDLHGVIVGLHDVCVHGEWDGWKEDVRGAEASLLCAPERALLSSFAVLSFAAGLKIPGDPRAEMSIPVVPLSCYSAVCLRFPSF